MTLVLKKIIPRRKRPAKPEAIRLVNEGASRLCISDWTIVHMSSDETHVHTFKFPLESRGDREWNVGPGDVVVVFSGNKPEGRDTRLSISWPREFQFWWGLSQPIWTNLADTVAIRNEHGVVVNQASVRALID